MKHASDSTEQLSAEQHILKQLSDKIDVPLLPAKVKLPSGVTILSTLFHLRKTSCDLTRTYNLTKSHLNANNLKITMNVIGCVELQSY